MSTHTPGPWVSDGMANDMMEFKIYSPTREVIARIKDFTTFREDIEQAEANAAFIVRACNAHEELVKALKLCVEALEFIPCRARNEATEALRLAEGGQP